MEIIQEYSLWIICILFILLLLAIVIIYIQYDLKLGKDKRGEPSSGTVSEKTYYELVENYNRNANNYKSLKTRYETLDKEYSGLKIQNKTLSNRIKELERDNAELNKLFEKESAQVTEQQFTTVGVPADFPKQQNQVVADKQEQPKRGQAVKETVPVITEIPSSEVIITKEEPPVVPVKEVVMYASFPRSAGSSIYFSDLTENRVDDSFFELKISKASGKATFKPLDFMKIRNYDPAMAAMLTNGVKPNVASTILGIEPGKAHVEGKDWIIDNPAKIKLA